MGGLKKSFKNLFSCRGKNSNPETWAVNKWKVESAENNTAESTTTDQSDANDQEENAAVVEEKNTPAMDGETTAEPSTGKVGGIIAGAAAIFGADTLATGSLSSSNQEKVESIETNAVQEIEKVDRNAVDEIRSIYEENKMVMEPVEPSSNTVGVTTASLAVNGAGQAARKTTMGSLDLGRISAIEKRSTEEIKDIDKKAGDEIAKIYESEGKWFDRPGASRAAGAAAVAGLPLACVKKIASIETHAEEKMNAIDKKAAKHIVSSDKKHAIHMYKLAKTELDIDFWDKEEDAAATKYFKIHKNAADDIAELDEKAEKQIKKIYKDKGKTYQKSRKEYFTARGAEGPTATAAAMETAAKMAKQRRAKLLNKNRSASPTTSETSGSLLESVGNTAHLAFYDIGAGVAKFGSVVTGADLEGPAEYDVRSNWSPQQRAAGCCA